LTLKIEICFLPATMNSVDPLFPGNVVIEILYQLKIFSCRGAWGQVSKRRKTEADKRYVDQDIPAWRQAGQLL
jgi:hypothetical protein